MCTVYIHLQAKHLPNYVPKKSNKKRRKTSSRPAQAEEEKAQEEQLEEGELDAATAAAEVPAVPAVRVTEPPRQYTPGPPPDASDKAAKFWSASAPLVPAALTANLPVADPELSNLLLAWYYWYVYW